MDNLELKDHIFPTSFRASVDDESATLGDGDGTIYGASSPVLLAAQLATAVQALDDIAKALYSPTSSEYETERDIRKVLNTIGYDLDLI